MEQIKEIVRRNEVDLAQRLQQGGYIPNEDLALILRTATTELGAFIRSVSPEVSRTLNVNFSEIGWDVKKNRSCQSTPPNLQDVHRMFASSLHYLEIWTSSIRPTQEEFEDLSKAATRLWDLDMNRVEPGVDYQINLQMGKNSYEVGDRATQNLFTFVHESVFQKPTFAAFISLLDNYERSVGVSETVTQQELNENLRFLQLIMETPVMKYCHRFLVAKRLAPERETEFISLINRLWFELYGRGSTNDSSGFEHVFVGEVKADQVTGLHNWVRIYQEERVGNLNYSGYIRPPTRGLRVTEPRENEQLITIQFEWFGDLKPVGSSFIGVSPEFEIALYTMFFLLGEEKSLVKVGPYSVEISCFPFRRRDVVYVGTAFPSAAPMSENQAATKIQAAFRGKQTRTTDASTTRGGERRK